MTPLCWGVLSEWGWRSKAWESRSGDGVSDTAMGRPRTQHICLLWGLREEATSETHPNWKRTKMVPACPHKDYETARGFGQDVCKILHYCSYLTDKQKPFKNITPQSCEFNWDSPKSFPHPLSSLAIICSVALWSCLIPVPGFQTPRAWKMLLGILWPPSSPHNCLIIKQLFRYHLLHKSFL